VAEEVFQILKRVMLEANQARTQAEPPETASINLPNIDLSRPARYEMDLADFPWVRFGRPQRAKTKIEPYIFTDVIRGPDGSPIERIWETYPHLKYGFPSESTQRLFIVLLDIWAEDAFLGDKINFRSITHLYHRLGGKGACPQDRAVRIDRDLQILEHLSFNAYNAFWNPKTNGYTDVKNLKLFGLSVYVHPKPVRRGQSISYQDELPFGYINVTNELRALARSKIFSADVPISLLLKLTGQEAKLAFHLAKRFIFYPVYKRRFEDVCKLIPIEAARADHRREQLRLICAGLMESDFSLLRSWKIEKENGEWMIEFTRARRPKQQQPSRKVRLEDLQGETRHLIDHILDAGGDEKSLTYWLMCIQALGQNTTYRAVSEANLFCRDNPGANFPKVLSSRFEAIAEEQGKVINPRRKPKIQ
jgi:hypothetical protein